MKRLSMMLRSLFIFLLVFSLFSIASAAEKEYIVHPKVRLFSMNEQENPGGFVVVGEEDLEAMLDAGLVDWYEENAEGELFGIEYDSVYTDNIIQYEMNMIKAKKAWELGCLGQGVKIAVIDSGVRPHIEFADRLLQGFNYGDNNTDTSDTVGHGTFTTGLIASAHDGYGIKSLAPKVEIVPFKVINSSGSIKEAAVSNAIHAAVDMHCDIINMSLGFTKTSTYSLNTLEEAISYALDNGVIVIAAVGNYSQNSNGNIVVNDTLAYPAAYEGVIGVGSVSYETGEVSYFSRKNSSVFISAPGEDVVSCYIKDSSGASADTYARNSGTSCAAPIVAATAAVLKNANPDLTSDGIADILKNSAVDAGDAGCDESYGYGILDVEKAMELANIYDVPQEAPQRISYIVRAQNKFMNDAIKVDGYTIGNIGSHIMNDSFTATAQPTYTLNGENYRFAYWTNGNGTYVSGSASYTFNATSNFTLSAVYDKIEAEESKTKAVEFWNGNGVYIDKIDANDSGHIDTSAIPEPEMTGYLFADMWKTESGALFDESAELSKPLTRVVAQFEEDNTKIFTATFIDGKNTNKLSGVYGKKVRYTAQDKENFDCWKIGDTIISYNPELEFALWNDVVVTAVYNAEKAAVVPSVYIDSSDEAHFIVYNAPEGFEIIDTGIVFGLENTLPTVGSFYSKASAKKLAPFGQFTAQAGDAQLHTVARGYLIYKNKISKTMAVTYSD